MSSHPIEARYRILFANFHDSERGQLWNERLGSGFRSAIELLIPAFGRDLAMRAQDLDREQLKTLLTSILPARMAGRESFVGDLPDLLEDFLIFLAEEEGVARQWEWTSAVNENRAGFEDALAQSDRPRLVPPKSEPHRRPGTKLGRNDPCPCGSGKKYKSCCLKLG